MVITQSDTKLTLQIVKWICCWRELHNCYCDGSMTRFKMAGDECVADVGLCFNIECAVCFNTDCTVCVRSML